MNYYKARQLADGHGKPLPLFHYTQARNGQIWAVGYCSPWLTCPECDGRSALDTTAPCSNCHNKGHIEVKEPCAGHLTAAGAQAHYQQYLIDTARLDGQMANQQQPCELCGAWTNRMAEVGPGLMEIHVLCDEHRTREQLTALVKVGYFISSY